MCVCVCKLECVLVQVQTHHDSALNDPRKVSQGFIHNQYVGENSLKKKKNLLLVFDSLRLCTAKNSAALESSVPGDSHSGVTVSHHHKSGANQSKNFIAHSNPRKHA